MRQYQTKQYAKILQVVLASAFRVKTAVLLQAVENHLQLLLGRRFGQRTDLLAPETELLQATILRRGTNQTDFRVVQRDIQVSLILRMEHQRLKLMALTGFIGDSAGATFIDKIRDFIRSSYPHIPRNMSYIPSHSVPVDPALSFTSAASSYYTHDSLPLSLPVTDPYTLPQKTTVLRHLDSFLNLCACGTSTQPVDGGGIFHWFNPSKIYLEIEALYEVTNYGPPLNGTVSPVDYTSLCVINMILALSCQVMATTGTSSTVEDELAGITAHWRHFVAGSEPISPHTHIDQAYHHTRENSAPHYAHNSANTLPGMTFFARAKLLLVNPVEEASLPSLRIITLMSYYLLSANRRDAAYMYIGLAVRMAVSHGLHRTWRKGEWVSGGIGRYNGPGPQFPSASSPEDQLRKLVQYEEKKREFWNIYILDRYDPLPIIMEHFSKSVHNITGYLAAIWVGRLCFPMRISMLICLRKL